MFTRLAALSLSLVLFVGCNNTSLPSSGGDHAAIHVNQSDFDAVVLNSQQPVLVDFWATWCGPCQQMGPVVEEVAAEFKGRAVVVKVDTDENKDLAQKYHITGIPAFVFFKNGKEVDRLIGSGTTKQQFAEKLNSLIQGS